MNRLMAGASLLAILAANAARAADAAAAPAPSDATVEEVIVTGTRQIGVKAADSAAPIQLVGSQQLTKTGAIDLAASLSSSVPSLNITTSGGDAAAIQVLAALRGLSPNDTLVLVDGKRRHTTSNLAVDGGSPYSGSATTDLSFIPIGAIDHIEVLTDGAAAQYGSDAIAGVVNVILKKSATDGTLSLTGGQYYNGEGTQGSVSVNKGFAIGDKGFVNLTFEEQYHDFSVQGIGDKRFTDQNGNPLTNLTGENVNALQAANFPHLNQLNGDPQFNLYNGFFNSGYKFNDNVEFYAFGNYSYRSAQHYENYRTPEKVSGVTSTGETVYPLPYGFDPREKFDEKDYSITAGLRGEFATWHWDLSTTYGGDNTQVYVVDSANAQLFPVLQALSATPVAPQTTFYNGAFDATEWTNNLDIDNSFNVGLAAPLNVAFGVEERRETYSISPGEPSSYYGAGAQSFDGYTPLDQGYYSRTNESVYFDLATDPIKSLHLDLAGRFEHYSDFGDTEIGKATVRYDFSPAIAIRGTVSSGFRAPTLAEEHYSGTNVSPSSADVQLPPNSSASADVGFGPLKPELSDNYSFGFVLHPAPSLQVTLDFYEIDLRDRILTSGFLYGTCCTASDPQIISQGVLNAIHDRGVSLDSNLSYTGISLFANAANTRTDGIELTANYASDFGDFGHVDWSVGFNYNHTQITKLDALPSQVATSAAQCVTFTAEGLPCNSSFLTPAAASALTTGTPREKGIVQAFWTKGPFSVNLRETIYGPSGQYTATAVPIFLPVGATGITDLDIGYKFNSKIKFDVGANNLFNIIGPVSPTIGGSPAIGGRVFNVPLGTWNTNGGYYYGRVTVSF
jgi:iron complex outermembrane receptor protein